MSEEKYPKEEIRKTLDGILGWVQQKKVAAKDTKNPSKPWGWVLGLIASVLVFVALAIAAWQAWKKGREIAKLKHKIDINKEDLLRSSVDAKMETLFKSKKDLEKKALQLKVKIDNDKSKIKWLEKERKAVHAKIDAVTSWEDVDRL